MKKIFICPRRHRRRRGGKPTQKFALSSFLLECLKPLRADDTRLAFGLGLLSHSQARANRPFGATASPSRRFVLVAARTALMLVLADKDKPRRCRRGLILLRPYGLVNYIFNYIFKVSYLPFCFYPPFLPPSFFLPGTKREDKGEREELSIRAKF